MFSTCICCTFAESKLKLSAYVPSVCKESHIFLTMLKTYQRQLS